jgi:SAM-dependent methyltransferase
MDGVTDWWTEFFHGSFGAVQVAGAQLERTLGEVNAIEQKLALPGAKIIDAPCGTGRHSLELARRGHQVVGIDFNAQVLDVARAAARSAGFGIDFRCQDLRALNDVGPYDAALCLWGSFGYFSDEENAAFASAVGRALRRGGVFFLDLPVSETLFPHFRASDWSWWGDGPERTRVLEERAFDHLTSRVESTWTFQRGGAEAVHRVSIRIYSSAELVGLLRRAGFSAFDLRGSDGAAFRFGARLWLAATKG